MPFKKILTAEEVMNTVAFPNEYLLRRFTIERNLRGTSSHNCKVCMTEIIRRGLPIPAVKITPTVRAQMERESQNGEKQSHCPKVKKEKTVKQLKSKCYRHNLKDEEYDSETVELLNKIGAPIPIKSPKKPRKNIGDMVSVESTTLTSDNPDLTPKPVSEKSPGDQTHKEVKKKELELYYHNSDPQGTLYYVDKNGKMISTGKTRATILIPTTTKIPERRARAVIDYTPNQLDQMDNRKLDKVYRTAHERDPDNIPKKIRDAYKRRKRALPNIGARGGNTGKRIRFDIKTPDSQRKGKRYTDTTQMNRTEIYNKFYNECLQTGGYVCRAVCDCIADHTGWNFPNFERGRKGRIPTPVEQQDADQILSTYKNIKNRAKRAVPQNVLDRMHKLHVPVPDISNIGHGRIRPNTGNQKPASKQKSKPYKEPMPKKNRIIKDKKEKTPKPLIVEPFTPQKLVDHQITIVPSITIQVKSVEEIENTNIPESKTYDPMHIPVEIKKKQINNWVGYNNQKLPAKYAVDLNIGGQPVVTGAIQLAVGMISNGKFLVAEYKMPMAQWKTQFFDPKGNTIKISNGNPNFIISDFKLIDEIKLSLTLKNDYAKGVEKNTDYMEYSLEKNVCPGMQMELTKSVSDDNGKYLLDMEKYKAKRSDLLENVATL